VLVTADPGSATARAWRCPAGDRQISSHLTGKERFRPV